MKSNQFFVFIAIIVVIIGILAISSNIAQAMTQTPTDHPTDLTATAVSPTQINLSWNAPTQNYYQQIQYQKNSKRVITNAIPTTETITNDLAGILTYQNYHLSSDSVPGPLMATAVSPTQINLSWLPPLENYQQKIIGYKIDLKRVTGDYVIIDDNKGNDTTK